MRRKANKLLERARQTKAGWMPDDLVTLYEGFGFTIREGRGSHKVVSHPRLTHLRAVIPNHPKELPKSYVSHAVKNIEQLIEFEKGLSDKDE